MEKDKIKNIAEAIIKKRSKVSVIWLIPLIALIIGSWLFYKSVRDAGTDISITFDTGKGIIAGKTLIKYEGVTVGTVKDVRLKEDFDGVIVDATINSKNSNIAVEGTIFWVVRPRLSLKEVSGLDALVSGVYITAQIGEGEEKEEFMGSTEPPLPDSDLPGTHIVLISKHSNSLAVGSPVYYRGIHVGEVGRIELDHDQQDVFTHVRVFQKYENLVTTNVRFWNSSGITVDASPSGLKVNTEGLEHILTGGISFDIKKDHSKGSVVSDDWVYTLYDNYDLAMNDVEDYGSQLQITLKSPHLGSLKPGSPIHYRQIKVGKVTGVELSDTAESVLIDAVIDKKYTPLVRENSVFWNASGVGLEIELFSAKVKTESLESLLSGGISFATPGGGKRKFQQGKRAKKFVSGLAKKVSNGHIFKLHDNLQDHWLEWAPKIPLNN